MKKYDDLIFKRFDKLQHILFIVVEKKHAKMYQDHLQEKQLTCVFLVVLQENEVPAKVTMDIAKLLADWYNFNFVYFVDHALEDTREWNPQVSHSKFPNKEIYKHKRKSSYLT